MSEHDEEKQLKPIEQKLDEISLNMEKLGIAEYVELLNHPRRLIWPNFIGGLARGFGMAIGFTILAALVIYLFRQLNVLNIPIIGKFIADIVDIVQNQMKY